MSEPLTFPPKLDVVGTGIAVTSYDEVIAAFRTPRTDRATVVAVCNVHSVMSARRDPQLRLALDHADIATPDGMPLVWFLRRSGIANQPRVYGPDLMRRALRDGGDLRHFLYGSSQPTLDRLMNRIAEEYPEAAIVGAISPPFGSLPDRDLSRHTNLIRESRADVVWVGLGMPKQELWMHRVSDELPGATLVGVGAAFDFIAGKVPQAPVWMQRNGLEWAFRLAQEPKRLWRRYLLNNPAFLLISATKIIQRRSTSWLQWRLPR